MNGYLLVLALAALPGQTSRWGALFLTGGFALFGAASIYVG